MGRGCQPAMRAEVTEPRGHLRCPRGVTLSPQRGRRSRSVDALRWVLTEGGVTLICDSRAPSMEYSLCSEAMSSESQLLHELVATATLRQPKAPAVIHGGEALDYAALQQRVAAFASGLLALGLARAERVAIYLDKRFETVIASFGAAAAGGVFVPVNPLLKPEQVAYILRDCNVRVLVTSAERLALLADALARVPRPAARRRRRRRAGAPPQGLARASLGRRCSPRRRAPAIASSTPTWRRSSTPRAAPASRRASCCRIATWSPARRASRSISRTAPDDTLLAALPLSFDAGFSQLTTAFHVGRARRAAQLPAAARRAQRARRASASPGSPPCRRCGSSSSQLEVAGDDRRAPALHREHRRPHAARDARRSCARCCRRRSRS